MLEKSIDPTNKDDDAICCLIDYLLRRHKDETRDALSKAGVIPSILNSFEVAALMNRASLGVIQWQQVVQYLNTFQGLKKISVPEKLMQMMRQDHGPVSSGIFVWKKEVGQRKIPIRWWFMDAEFEIKLRLTEYANGINDFDPANIESIFAIFLGNHGKGKHRSICNLVVRTVGRVKWNRIIPLGDISSSKETCEIFKGTITDNMAKGINAMVDSHARFTV
jgi:hypothetical protein